MFAQGFYKRELIKLGKKRAIPTTFLSLANPTGSYYHFVKKAS